MTPLSPERIEAGAHKLWELQNTRDIQWDDLPHEERALYRYEFTSSLEVATRD